MIPKRFIPARKKIAKEAEDLVHFGPSGDSLELLIKGYEEFLENNFYSFAEKIVANMEYANFDLQPFCDKLIKYEGHENFCDTGLYLSALVNKVMQEDEKLLLELPKTAPSISYVGTSLSKGTLIIKGNLGDFTGNCMSGGKLIVKGRVMYYTATFMEGGELHAEIIQNISEFYKGGEVYANNRRLRPR